MDGTVLIADDDRTIRTVLTQALTRAGCRVHATGSLAQLGRWVAEARPDLVITDVVMPDGNGIELIPALRRARPDLPIIVISAQNTIVTAVRAQAAEAFDYLPKPFDLPDLMARVRAALDQRRGGAARAEPEARPAPDPALPMVGHAPAMQALFRTVARLIASDLPVLISGEAGSGRSTLARSLHELSARRDRGVVVLSPADEAEAVLARARAAGRGGTLIIEDPAGFDPAAQARLAALLETLAQAPEPPRVIATADPDPQATVASGRLRADLYWRLAGATLVVPPLRARPSDIAPLARHLLDRAAAAGGPARSLSAAAESVLRAHPFPGNVRELENLVQRLALTAASAEITAGEAIEAIAATAPPVARTTAAAAALDPSRTAGLADLVEAQLRRYFELHGGSLPPPGLHGRVLDEVERPLIALALEATAGNQLKAAALLGINRNTLRKKVKDLNIDVTRGRRLM